MGNSEVNIRGIILSAAKACQETLRNSRKIADAKALAIFNALKEQNKGYASNLNWQAVIPLITGVAGAAGAIVGAVVNEREHPWLKTAVNASPKTVSLLGKTATQYAQGSNHGEYAEIEASKQLRDQTDRMSQIVGDALQKTVDNLGRLLQATKA